jgi:hypothetical protein
LAAVAQLATSALPRKLRVGIFADGALQPRWVVEAFAKVAACEFAEIALIASAKRSAQRPPALWRLYGALDKRIFAPRARLEEPLELARYVSHRRACAFDGETQLAGTFAAGLDVAFALGDIDDRALDGIARYGVWRFYGDGESEVLEGAALTGSGVEVRLAADAEPRIAYQSWSRTYPLSVARNRAQLLAKSAEFAWRALREAQRAGRGWLEQCPTRKGTAERSEPGFGPVLRRILARGVDKALHREQWFIAFRHGQNGDAIPADLAGFTRIVPPREHTWADPFAIEHGGRHFVFFEELPFASGKAHISMMEIGADARWSKPVRVLERDHHLSYPFVFEHEGALYMIPETAQAGTVELYRCTEFPLRWRRERVLLEGVHLVDATLERSAGRWWLFANSPPGSSRLFDDELHLYHSEQLLGDWQPHPRNPIKSDARCARPAGKLFWRAGALYRPAQICVPRYGAGLSMNRVLRLTPEHYAERQIERIVPPPESGLLGLHTVNRAGALTVVDALTRRLRCGSFS